MADQPDTSATVIPAAAPVVADESAAARPSTSATSARPSTATAAGNKKWAHIKKQPFDINNDTAATGAYLDSKLDGHKIYCNIWKPASQPIAVVLAFHGLGEHIHRYEHVFSEFAANGILVKGMDHRGHGRTLRKNGAIKGFQFSFAHVFSDMDQLYELPVEPFGDLKAVPTFVFGHSLGGLYALSYADKDVATRIPAFKGVISQSPALRTAQPVPGLLAALAKGLGGPLGKVTKNNDLILAGLCSDESVIETYVADPLNHDQISFRLGKDTLQFSETLMANPSTFTHPLIMHFAEGDLLTHYGSGEKFVKEAGSSDKTFVGYPAPAEHEIHNEPAIKTQLIATYVAWIKERAATTSP